MISKRAILAIVPVLAFHVPGVAAPSLEVAAEAAPIADKEAFDLLKNLAGEWTGTVNERDSGPPATVIYRVVAGGSVVEEQLFPGTEHEMVTMYHLDGGQLVLTHYCAMGNQPHMALQSGSTAERLVFDFVSGGNMDSTNDMHMHSGVIRFLNANQVEALWAVFHEGKKIGENRFFLHRKAE